MRNFHKLANGINVIPLVHQIVRQPGLWNQNNLRTTHPMTPHSQVDDIWLRFQCAEYVASALSGDPAAVIDQHESVDYPAMATLPGVRPIIWDLMRLVEGERLGRVLITRLAPGKVITTHVDSGDHAAYYQRYHVCLANLPGVLFRCGEEYAPMITGDLWWFDNSIEHEVINNSADDRLAMIIDIKCGGP